MLFRTPMSELIKTVPREDIVQLSELEAANFSPAWSSQTLLKSIDNPRHQVVGFYAPELIGFAIFAYLLDEAELLRIAVSQAQRGQGIGLQLLQQQMLQMPAQGIEKVFLEVRASNQAAQALYQRCGFKLDGRRKNYYAAQGTGSEHAAEDALLFSAAL